MESGRKNYHTKQKDLILNLLSQHPNQKLTAEEMLEMINQKDHHVSKATIYRNLDSLVNAGIIQKIILDNFCSCYIYSSENSNEIVYFCCDTCGKIMTMKSSSINRLNNKLEKEYELQIDHSKTVFHGICNACLGEKTYG